jgi:glyoxylase-like metal-dependent hydrolase (beta-lactamase superfamily II)
MNLKDISSKYSSSTKSNNAKAFLKFKDCTLHLHKGYVQNNYIVEYNDGLLMLDGASRPDVDSLEGFIKKDINRSMSDLRLIAVTHCHPDHAGAAHLMRKKFSIAIAAPESIDLWYSGFGGALQHISDTLQSTFMATQMKSGIKWLYYKRKLDPDFILSNNSRLPFFNDWQAINAPGHTGHNIMLYNEKNSIIYIADSIIDNGSKFLPPVPVLFPEMMKESLAMIKKIKPEYLLLAHSSMPFLRYNEQMIDSVIKKIDAKDPLFIRFFYLLSKFTGQYRALKK